MHCHIYVLNKKKISTKSLTQPHLYNRTDSELTISADCTNDAVLSFQYLYVQL